ncbi:MAG: ferredoxin-thioredoxin reductase catalytic chain [Myxococcota bacterium]|jgi:ferredoxin-thioredoxin reductase catalytic chain
MSEPSEKSIAQMTKFAAKYAAKTGTHMHPEPDVSELVIQGLAMHKDTIGRPLCPCRFYPDKEAEIKHRTWICACEDMKVYKYCHCLLFVAKDGNPITEYLPEGHEGREIYGDIKDPTPELGRESRHKAAEREEERKNRLS